MEPFIQDAMGTKLYPFGIDIKYDPATKTFTFRALFSDEIEVNHTGLGGFSKLCEALDEAFSQRLKFTQMDLIRQHFYQAFKTAEADLRQMVEELKSPDAQARLDFLEQMGEDVSGFRDPDQLLNYFTKLGQ
jgi:hypothetical protein